MEAQARIYIVSIQYRYRSFSELQRMIVSNLLINYQNPTCLSSPSIVPTFKYEMFSLSGVELLQPADVTGRGFYLDDINACVPGTKTTRYRSREHKLPKSCSSSVELSASFLTNNWKKPSQPLMGLE